MQSDGQDDTGLMIFVAQKINTYVTIININYLLNSGYRSHSRLPEKLGYPVKEERYN